MVKYEEKFFVINKKHLAQVPADMRGKFTEALSQIRQYLPEHKYYVCNQDEPYAQDVLKLILFEEMKQAMENSIVKEYNAQEVAHLAVNYAVNCQKGYSGTFEDWLKGLSPDWRKIANKKR